MKRKFARFLVTLLILVISPFSFCDGAIEDYRYFSTHSYMHHNMYNIKTGFSIRKIRMKTSEEPIAGKDKTIRRI